MAPSDGCESDQEFPQDESVLVETFRALSGPKDLELNHEIK